MVFMKQDRHLDAALLYHYRALKEICILLGSRQTGKTTILKKLFPTAVYLTVDNESTKSLLEQYDISAYKLLIPQKTSLLIIDEIHLLTDPGRAAKILYDQAPHLRIMVTGSSAFTIKNKATESLAGRKIDYHLYPLSLSELLVQTGSENSLCFPILRYLKNDVPLFPTQRPYPFDLTATTHHAMQFGLYPGVIDHPQKDVYMRNLVDSIVFKDLLDLSLIKNKVAARNLLRLLAYQIGNLVNINELAMKLGIDVKTVRRYIALFEQSYILFSLTPFTGAGRKEIGKMPKIYFYDCGLRNALLDNFQPISERPDRGQLFENLVVSEILKANYYGNFCYTLHFWRTTDGSEVDIVLKKGKTITAFEVKSATRKANTAFKRRYPDAFFTTITPENYY